MARTVWLEVWVEDESELDLNGVENVVRTALDDDEEINVVRVVDPEVQVWLGDPLGGFTTVYGFASNEDALEWAAATSDSDDSWWIADVQDRRAL